MCVCVYYIYIYIQYILYVILFFLFFASLHVMLRCYQKCIFIFCPCPGLGRDLVNNLNIRIQQYSWEFLSSLVLYELMRRMVRNTLLPYVILYLPNIIFTGTVTYLRLPLRISCHCTMCRLNFSEQNQK